MFTKASAISTRSRSPTATPPRKRQRLSSPTFDQGFDDLTQEDLAAFDAIDASLSQAANASQSLKMDANRNVESRISSSPIKLTTTAHLPSDDAENPFTSGFSAVSKALTPGFACASALPASSSLGEGGQRLSRSPSPDHPREPNYEDWFNNKITAAPDSFATPVFMKLSTTAKVVGQLVPSEKALAAARAKLAAWESEDVASEGASSSENPSSLDLGSLDKLGGFGNAAHLSDKSPTKRPALSTVSNVLASPSTPISTFRPPTSTAGFAKARVTALSQKPTAFKSPMMHTPTLPSISSPLNPHRPPASSGFQPSSRLASTPYVSKSPSKPSTSSLLPSATPAKLKTRPAKFVTPFKNGVPRVATSMPRTTPTPARKSPIGARPLATPKSQRREKFFNLDPPPTRTTLAASGLVPQQYDSDDLDSYGIDTATLNQITPITAQFYSFHADDGMSQSKTLGSQAAHEELQQLGCTLATKPWVDNHWCLVLWKLAGMVALNPEKESDPNKRRWCWDEVLRQLRYRYEREMNMGIRPPLRKVANQDAPAQLPMCLCVSNIIWSEGGVTEDGLPIQPHPELELTDGWYRLRAQVDQAMARAVRKGVIRIGRKIGIAAARVDSEKKEPSEVLDAYSSVKLVLSGNASHLMPWHTKLGFLNARCISTLHSLSPDGGLVAMLDFVIIKMFPIAFLEFKEDEDGNKYREGPRAEAEESKVQEQWKRRRQLEASKLHEDFDKKYARLEGYISRMEQKAGSKFKSPEGDPPADIELMYDRLEYPDTASGVLARLTPVQSGWLAQYTKRQTEVGREKMGEEIEQELQKICPPREVRSFRVLVAQDARTQRRPANRTAQLTVWDVLSLGLDEESSGGNFAVGQRYLATNLIPTQLGAWMDTSPQSEIYLCTRRDTRWTRVKTVVE